MQTCHKNQARMTQGRRCYSLLVFLWLHSFHTAVVRGNDELSNDRHLRASVGGDFFGLFSVKTCSETSGVFETTKTSRITAFLRLLLGNSNANDGDRSGSCDALCSSLCPKTCYADFNTDGTTCTCNQLKCSGNGLCNSNDQCVCKSGFNGNGVICCDTNAGLSLVDSTCKAPLAPTTPTRTASPVATPKAAPIQPPVSVPVPLPVSLLVFGRDIEPPEILSFAALSPLTVNVTNGPAKIDFSLTVRDASSGTQKVYVYAESSQGITFAFEPSSPIVGRTVQVNVSLTIPAYTEAGDYFLYVAAFDNATNELELEPLELAKRKFPYDITVVNRKTDKVAPEVKKITPTKPIPLTVPINSTIVFELEMQDDLGGVSAVYMGLTGSLSASGTIWAFGQDLYDCPAGAALCKGRIAFEITRFAQLDNYTFTLYISDYEGNSRQYNATQLSTLFGLPSVIRLV